MSYQLDSDTSVEIPRGNRDVELRLRLIRRVEIVFVSAITAAELLHGDARSPEPVRETQQVERFLVDIRTLPVDVREAQLFAATKAQLQASGNSIADFDLLIAATALAHGHTLVTHNTRHFARIPGLLLDDWLV